MRPTEKILSPSEEIHWQDIRDRDERIAFLEKRVDDLLGSNNAEVERRRTAEHEVGRLKAILDKLDVRSGLQHIVVETVLKDGP